MSVENTCRMDKDKAAVQREVEDLQASVDSEGKGRANAEKLAKQLELQVCRARASCSLVVALLATAGAVLVFGSTSKV